MSQLSLVTGLVLKLLLLAPGQAPSPPVASSTYRELVDAYRESGPPQAELVAILSQDRVTKDVEGALAEPAGWTWEELRAAAMLHSDAAIRRVRDKDSAGADFHLVQARRLLDRVAAIARPQEDFVWRWYTAMAALLEELRATGLARRLRVYGAKRWPPTGARERYVRGIQFEARGNAGGRVLRPGESRVVHGPEELRSHWFVLAAEAFAAALKEDPKLGCAALHLGRIRMIQGNFDEAAGLLRQALTDVDPAVAYLAHLFLGSLEERNDSFEKAEQLYRQAIVVFPYGQSAPLALAQLLSRTNRDGEARTVLFNRPPKAPRAIEPGWAFAAGLTVESGTRIAMLRAETWK